MISLLRRVPPVCFIPALICGFAFTAASTAQTSTSSSSSSNASAPKTGFAIESEMMTYSAMDAEATALACGITRNLGATDDKCTPRGMSGPAGGIIVVSSPSSALAEFQIWRTDMSTMTMLTMRATPYCPKTGERAASSTTSIGSTILSMIPAGQALTFAQALLSTTSESSPVQGNILDDTLINDVSGHLRALGVVVVIPDTYMPGSLTTIDQRLSPFMSKFGDLLKARVCLDPSRNDDQSTSPGADRSAQVELEKKAIAESIDGFLKGLADSGIAMPPKPPSTTTPATATTPAPPQPVISHLNAVLRADGLAQEIAAASPDAQASENGGWFLLSLKALESGGTELKTGNVIRGSKAIFSGGSVGTYSLFRLTGSVVCSGVFFNYSGALESTKIPKMLEQPSTLGSGRLVGGCATSQ
jgi:hypothetical protein